MDPATSEGKRDADERVRVQAWAVGADDRRFARLLPGVRGGGVPKDRGPTRPTAGGGGPRSAPASPRPCGMLTSLPASRAARTERGAQQSQSHGQLPHGHGHGIIVITSLFIDHRAEGAVCFLLPRTGVGLVGAHVRFEYVHLGSESLKFGDTLVDPDTLISDEGQELFAKLDAVRLKCLVYQALDSFKRQVEHSGSPSQTQTTVSVVWSNRAASWSGDWLCAASTRRIRHRMSANTAADLGSESRSSPQRPSSLAVSRLAYRALPRTLQATDDQADSSQHHL